MSFLNIGLISSNYNITTPALLFSAISLLMIAFTNRFHNLANLVRNFIASYEKKPDEDILRQLDNFKMRLKLIKYTQAFGILSFILCAMSMLFIMFDSLLASEVLFVISLTMLILALILAFLEIVNSITALDIELEKIEKTEKK